MFKQTFLFATLNKFQSYLAVCAHSVTFRNDIGITCGNPQGCVLGSLLLDLNTCLTWVRLQHNSNTSHYSLQRKHTASCL